MIIIAFIIAVIALIVAIYANNRRKDNLKDIKALVENGLRYEKQISEAFQEISKLKKEQ